MRAGVGDAGLAGVRCSTAIAVPTSTSSGVTRIAIDAIFISYASIFLPRYSGVRPIIRPAMKTARIAKIEHAVEAGADAAEDDFAELHQQHRHRGRRAA